MKKISLLLFLTLVLLSVSFSYALAAMTLDVSIKNDVMTISGNTGSSLPYTDVTVRVVYPDASEENVTDAATLKENLYYYNQKNSTVNGSYSFEVDMDGAAEGRYSVAVYSNGAKEIKDIVYVTETSIAGIIKNVNLKSTGVEIAQILDITTKETDTSMIFNLEDELIFSVSSEDLMDVFAKLNFVNKINPEKPKELSDKILLSAVMTALNEGKSFDIAKYSELLDLQKDYLDTYNTKLSDVVKSVFSTSFKGSNPETLSSVARVFKNNVILSVINNLRNRSDIEYVISKHGNDIGINEEQFNNFLYKDRLIDAIGSLAPYATTDILREKYNELYISISNQSGPMPSTGGSGGGGGSSSAGFDSGIDDSPVSSENFVPEVKVFDDLDNVKWAEEYILKLYEMGIVKGVSETSYAPGNPIKREEYIKMIVSALEIDGTAEELSFTDSDENSWYYDYLKKAYSAGLVKGYSDGTFGIGKNITREEMIAISYRAALYKNKKFSSESENFIDHDEISDYAKDAVYSFKNAQIVSGSENMVRPKDNLTRAEAAKIICLLMEYGGI